MTLLHIHSCVSRKKKFENHFTKLWSPPICPSGRHLANTIEFGIPSAHRSPQPKRQINQFSSFCTAYGNGRPFPPKLSLPMGDLDPSNLWFLGPIRIHNPNGASIGSAVFAQVTVECPYTLQWDAPSPPKIAPPHNGCGPPSNNGFLGSPESSTRTAARSLQPFLQGSLERQTDRQTTLHRF